MKVVVWYGKNDLRYEDKEIPQIEDDEVLLKVAYAGICGSDLHIIEGKLPEEMLSPPLVLGHEFSGTVAKVGKKVTEYKEGQEITAHPWVGCGECYFCKRAQENFCQNPFCVLHNERSGAFAEYMIVKAKQVYALPKGMSLKTAALIEPMSIAVHAMDLANIKTGYSVAVLGGGIIGLACLQVALRVGAGLMILSDPVEARLEIGKKLGADIVVNPLKQNLKEVVMEATNGLGVDTVLEAVGVQATLDAAIPITKNAGTVMVVGVAPQGMKWTVNPQEINMRELCIQGTMWSPYSFIRTIGLMDKLETDLLATHVFPLSEFEKALEVQRNREGIKILFKP